MSRSKHPRRKTEPQRPRVGNRLRPHRCWICDPQFCRTCEEMVCQCKRTAQDQQAEQDRFWGFQRPGEWEY